MYKNSRSYRCLALDPELILLHPNEDDRLSFPARKTPSIWRHRPTSSGSKRVVEFTELRRMYFNIFTSNRKARRAMPAMSCSASAREPYGSLMWTICSWTQHSETSYRQDVCETIVHINPKKTAESVHNTCYFLIRQNY